MPVGPLQPGRRKILTFKDFRDGVGGKLCRRLGLDISGCIDWHDFTSTAIAFTDSDRGGTLAKRALRLDGVASRDERASLHAGLMVADLAGLADGLGGARTWRPLDPVSGDYTVAAAYLAGRLTAPFTVVQGPTVRVVVHDEAGREVVPHPSVTEEIATRVATWRAAGDDDDAVAEAVYRHCEPVSFPLLVVDVFVRGNLVEIETESNEEQAAAGMFEAWQRAGEPTTTIH